MATDVGVVAVSSTTYTCGYRIMWCSMHLALKDRGGPDQRLGDSKKVIRDQLLEHLQLGLQQQLRGQGYVTEVFLKS